MRLSQFILDNRHAISKEWQEFARGLPPGGGMTKLQLANHLDEVLTFIAHDIATKQTDKEQFDKSRGQQVDQSPGVDTAAQIHASSRHKDGFDIVEMVSEYRALRASISKLWARARKTLTEQDLDDLGRLNEAIDQAVAESVLRFTQDVDHAKDLLLGVLGHDIRGPVGAIQLASDLVAKSGPLNSQQIQLLDHIKTSAGRVQVIVQDLLDLARSKAGQGLPLKKAPCSLLMLSEGIVEEIRLRHPDREVDLVSQGLIEGFWDEVRLGQLLSNLLANAMQYGAADQPVIVSISQDEENATIAVTNAGTPIPASHLEAIFKSFSRVPMGDPDREVPTSNLGLGLFISREIANAHGGTISVVSDASQGTTFAVRLPKHSEGRSG